MAESALAADVDEDRQRAPSLRRNIVAIYSAHVINGVLSIVVVPLALRQFGSDGYGLFAIYGVLTLCCNLFGMGLCKHFTRMLASNREPTAQVDSLRVAWAFRLTASFILLASLPALCVIVPVLLFPVDSLDVGLVRWLVVLAAADYVLMAPTEMIQTLCIANERIDRYSAFTVVSGLCRYGLMFLGILTCGTPLATVVFLTGRRLFEPWLAYRIMGRLPAGAWRPRFELRVLGQVLCNSSLLSLSQLAHVGMLTLGSVLANAFCGLSGLGIYRAAFDLSSRLWLISNGLGLVVFPRFSHLLAAKDRSASSLARLPVIQDASWAGYLVFCTASAWVAGQLAPLLHVPSQPTKLFMLILLGTGMNAHANLSYEFLQAGGKYVKTILVLTLATGTLAVSFFCLHGRLGMLSLGWAWIIAQFVYAVAADVEAARLAGYTPSLLVRQASSRLFVGGAAVAATMAGLLSAPLLLVAPLLVACPVAFCVALYALRAANQPAWKGPGI